MHILLCDWCKQEINNAPADIDYASSDNNRYGTWNKYIYVICLNCEREFIKLKKMLTKEKPKLVVEVK